MNQQRAGPDIEEPKPLGGYGPLAALLVAGVVLVVGFLFGITSGQSTHNCGELPGLTRAVSMLMAGAIALVIGIAGLIAAAATRSLGLLLAFGLAALAVPLGVALGQGMASKLPCDFPSPVPVPATIDFQFTSPFAGEHPGGPGECRSNGSGETFYEVASQGNLLTDWRFGTPSYKFVDVEIWPVVPGPYRPAQHLRVTINRPGASTSYSDGGSGRIQLDTNVVGNSGSIDFTNLPAVDVHGSGLPASISGHVTWTCSGVTDN
jgi:hypothetical protein